MPVLGLFKDLPGANCFDYVLVRVEPRELGLEENNLIEDGDG